MVKQRTENANLSPFHLLFFLYHTYSLSWLHFISENGMLYTLFVLLVSKDHLKLAHSTDADENSLNLIWLSIGESFTLLNEIWMDVPFYLKHDR